MLDSYSVSLKEVTLKTTLLFIFLSASVSGLAQTYSSDTCVLISTSRMLNLGMDKVYTNATGPVKSILMENKKWLFDSTGNIIEELNFTAKEPAIINRRKVAEYAPSGQVKSISLYDKKDSEGNLILGSQERYTWSGNTRTLVHIMEIDTVRSVIEKVNKNGCIEFKREEKRKDVFETRYSYNLLGLQTTKAYKHWNNDVLKQNFETRLLYNNGILHSRVTINYLTDDTTYMNYHLDNDELKGYLIDPSNSSDSTHTISKNSSGEIIFRQFPKQTFYLTNSTKNGIRYKFKTYIYEDETKKIDSFEFLSNGDVSITITEDGERQGLTTKKQTFDDRGNWIKLATVREQLNKPTRENTVFREIEYF